MKFTAIVFGIAFAFLLQGCAPKEPPLYYWGNYQTQVYQMYCEPGEAPPERQLEIMEADIEVARSKGLSLPPGYRAHMGYMYAQLGKYDQAIQAFESEKTAFPESASLMDRFIQRIKGNDA